MKEIGFVIKLQGDSLKVLYSILENLVTFQEDNQGSIALAVAPQMRHRTKHIAINYHHLQSFIANGDVEIQYIDTKEQIVDIFMKPLDSKLFGYLRYKLNGW